MSDIRLGSGFSSQPQIKQGTPQIFEIDVPTGSTDLRIQIGKPSDASADLDLYLFDCTGKQCMRRDQSVSDGADEMITVANPTAGKWKVVIDPYSVPTGQTTCAYSDLFLNPNFGELKSDDAKLERRALSRWTAELRFAAVAPPASPRFLAAFAAVRSKDVYFEEARFNMVTREPEPSIRFPLSLGSATIPLSLAPKAKSNPSARSQK